MEGTSIEKEMLNDVASKGTIEELEEHDVHAEGKICEKDLKSPNDSAEFEHKPLEPSGDAVDSGNTDESLQYNQRHESEEKNEGHLSSINTPIDENPVNEHFTKSKTGKKCQKVEKDLGFESLTKNIGDRKQVKFIMKDDPKFSGDKAHRAKERGARNVYTAGKGTEFKRQNPAGKDSSPQRDKPKEKTKSTCKKRDISKKDESPKREFAENSDENDSGEDYWSKSTGESTIKLDADEPVKVKSPRSRPKIRDESSGRAGGRKRGLRRSSSAEHKKGLTTAVSEVKQDLVEDVKPELTLHDTGTSLENSHGDDIPLTIDIADVDGSDSDDEGCTGDRDVNIDTAIADSGNEDVIKTEDILLAENLPLPVSDDAEEASVTTEPQPPVEPVPTDDTSTVATPTAPTAAAPSWDDRYAQAVAALSSAGCYRMSLCVGWLLWAAWIMRLMGFRGEMLGSWGLMELMSVVEVLGLVQLMWLLLRPAAPAPAPVPAIGPAPSPATAASAPDKQSSEQAIADTVL